MSPSKTFSLGDLAGLLAALLALAIVGSVYLYNQNPAAECGHAEAANNQSATRTQTPAPDHGSADQLEERPKPAEHRETCFLGHNAEQWLALLTAWLVLGTFLLAGYTALLWRDARQAGEEARKQTLELFTIERRPWVQAQIAPVGRLVIDRNDKRVMLSFQVTFENFGRTPASTVFAQTTLYIGFGEWDFLRDWMERHEEPPGNPVGDIVFPAQVFVSEPPVFFNGILSEDDPTHWRFCLVGWAAYRADGMPSLRRTPFCYTVDLAAFALSDRIVFEEGEWGLTPSIVAVQPD